MALTCLPFDNTPAASEQQWSDMARLFTPDGIDGAPSGSAFRVTAGTGLNVNIAAGPGAMIRGMVAKDSVGSSLGLPANNTSSPRIDLVVIRVNWSTNTAIYFAHEGTPAASPAIPTPTYTGTIYDLPLAAVRVESTDTISSVLDRRQFLPLNGIVPCTSGGRPDPKGRPMLAYETDTKRTISTSGDGNWNVGMGTDLFSPIVYRSQSPGNFTSLGWTDRLVGSASPVFSVEFNSGPSGRVLINFGAFISRDRADAHVTVKVTGTGGTVHVDDGDFFVSVTSDAEVGKPGDNSGASVATLDVFELPPNGQFVAEMHYKSSAAGVSPMVRNRFMLIQRLP